MMLAVSQRKIDISKRQMQAHAALMIAIIR